ncbi:chemotaxis protein histidine kinase CheA [Natronospira proteinivora]|uniref:Chemotaxis protein histidine kinase CheA n=1 Tax=Natronospira proteinivora TaxID=1807133 RepID=A0ABT1G9A8_9GAMM|nr:hypothetical protein [Natronospira proteinivora]MCP1727903.1 chemotaxis protein histidine kinase CheA [Natronospira proteinivora]
MSGSDPMPPCSMPPDRCGANPPDTRIHLIGVTMPQSMETFGEAGMSGAPEAESSTLISSQQPEHMLLSVWPVGEFSRVSQVLSQAGAVLSQVPPGGTALPPLDPDARDPVILSNDTEEPTPTVTRVMNEGDSVHALFVVEGPVAYIARALHAGEQLEKAADNWRAQAESALAQINQYRLRCLTVQLEQVLAAPETFTKLLTRRYGLNLQAVEAPEAGSPETALYSILAAQHVNQEPEISDLALELEASAWPLTEDPDRSRDLDIRAAVEAYRGGSRELEEFRKQYRELESLRSEREEMLAQLHKVQLELEEHFNALNKERASHEATRKALKKAKEGDVKALETRLAEAEKARDQALEQKAESESSLKEILAELKTERSQHEQVQKQLKALETAQQGKEQSSKEREQLEARIKDLQQENETMLEQLHKVQLELEDYFLRHRDEATRNKELTKQLKTLKEDVSKRDKQIESQKKAASQNARAVHDLESEITSLKRSRSWRLTRPVRAIGRILRRLKGRK